MGKLDSISSQNSCLLGFVRIEKALLENGCLMGVTAWVSLWKEWQFDLWHSPVGARLCLLFPLCRQEAQGHWGKAQRQPRWWMQPAWAQAVLPYSPEDISDLASWPSRRYCLAEVEMAVQDKKGEKSNTIQVTHSYILMFYLSLYFPFLKCPGFFILGPDG